MTSNFSKWLRIKPNGQKKKYCQNEHWLTKTLSDLSVIPHENKENTSRTKKLAPESLSTPNISIKTYLSC